MESVADDLRVALRHRLATMTPDERLAMTARLAENDLDAFCAARCLGREEGRRLLAQRRQAGRLPSRAAQERTP
jgi:hypothetical protein